EEGRRRTEEPDGGPGTADEQRNHGLPPSAMDTESRGESVTVNDGRQRLRALPAKQLNAHLHVRLAVLVQLAQQLAQRLRVAGQLDGGKNQFGQLLIHVAG